MNTRTGEVHQKETKEQMEEFLNTLSNKERKYFKEMKVVPTLKQMSRRPPKVGRNEPCPCGSGKKFKKCCLV